MLPWGVSCRGPAIVLFGLCFVRTVLLFCPWRVHSRGGVVNGRYYVSVKTVLLIWFGDFTSIFLFVEVFLSRSYCVALDREIDAGLEIERFRIGIAV